MLSEFKIYRTSFSKYGTEYKKTIVQKISEGERVECLKQFYIPQLLSSKIYFCNSAIANIGEVVANSNAGRIIANIGNIINPAVEEMGMDISISKIIWTLVFAFLSGIIIALTYIITHARAATHKTLHIHCLWFRLSLQL